jgi:hypothetical protein
MADEKKYSPREVALALLAKSQEILAKTSLAPAEATKVAECQSGMHTVGYYSTSPFEKGESLDCGFEPFQKHEKMDKGTAQPAPSLAMSEDGLCEKHGGKAGKMVKSEMCKSCKSEVQKSELSDLYETLAKIESIEKYEGEDPHKINEIGTPVQKSEGQGSGIKKEPSDEMKHGVSEEQAPQRDAQDFEPKPGHAPENDHREEQQVAPEKNPAEQKEGNNPDPGSAPQAKSTPGTGTKGVHKLSHWMGMRHGKNGMKKGIALG